MSTLIAMKVLLLSTRLPMWCSIVGVAMLADAISNRKFLQEFKYKYPNIINGIAVCLINFIVHPFIGIAHFHLLRFAPHGLFHLPDLAHDSLTLIFGIAIYFFVADFFYYWCHRAQHSFRHLWAWHAVHHSDPHYNVTTYMRQHWTEGSILALLMTTPMLILFGNEKIPLICGWLFTGWNFFMHTNRNIGTGFWTRIVTTPNQHRLHHALDERYHNTNFAGWFPLWDIIFGTFAEGHSGPIETGLSEKEHHLHGVQIDMLWRHRPSGGLAPP